jgi:nucleotide-binding universal stress UspA family protein
MTILVSYVPTTAGFWALGAGMEEAKVRGTSLTVVNVGIGLDASGPTFADEKDLDAVRARLIEVGLDHEVRQVIDATTVAEAVLTLAKELTPELIVVGLRRVNPLGIALLGSNAQRIILGASCPVLSIRPTE